MRVETLAEFNRTRLSGESELEDIELNLLLEGIWRHYGFDFREYAKPSLRRRVKQYLSRERLPNISALQEKILRDIHCLEDFLVMLNTHVRGIFRNPDFFRSMRERVVPLLKTYPSLRIWQVGCSNGEELYSLAILLKEENLYEKTKIYATDIHSRLLQKAREGRFPSQDLSETESRYRQTGGKGSFSDYISLEANSGVFESSLKKNIIFATHNIVTDSSFNEFNMIICRDVMIYFNQELQERVLKLLRESLVVLGFLALGSKESMRTSPQRNRYEEVDATHKLYRRVR